MSPIDLDAYLRRIGFAVTPRPDLATLAELHRLHAQAIPFENLSAFVAEPIALDAASLEAKLVRGGRGGWCFEHNLLFRHALAAIGFEVHPLAARVRWNVPPHVVTPRSHCLLRVPIEGEDHIADVGFGGLTLTAPLRLHASGEQATPHESFRILPRDAGFALEARLEGEWQTLYLFELNPAHQADYEVSNWYLAHHPQSQFVTGVIAARAGQGERHALRNTRYAVHRPGRETERREIGSARELRELLVGPFGIRLDRVPALDTHLDRLFEPR
jgi:N-hydroxyarylamine O-acetyltransferase